MGEVGVWGVLWEWPSWLPVRRDKVDQPGRLWQAVRDATITGSVLTSSPMISQHRNVHWRP